MTALEELTAEVVTDFKRRGCTCRHCKGDQGDPNARHGQGAPLVTSPRDPSKMVTYRRPSSFAKPLEDTYHLDLWSKRTVAIGVAATPALAATIANCNPDTDKKRLDELVEEAIRAAKGTQAADLGSELHRVVERLNDGTWTIDDVPEMFRADAEAYLAELDRHGLTVVAGTVEVKLVNDEVRAAGTADVILADGSDNYSADFKSGRDPLKLSTLVQHAIYAHSKGYRVDAGERYDLPPVRKDVALTIHLPYGSGRCTIHDADIVTGWEAAQLANTARSWNYRKGFFAERASPSPSTSASPAKPRRGNAVALPKPEARPKPDEGGAADAAKVAALIARVRADGMAPVRTQVAAWVAEGAAAGVAWNLTEANDATHTRRRLTLNVAAVELAERLAAGDETGEVARAALALVVGEDAHKPMLSVGGLIGSLTIEQGRALYRLAHNAALSFGEDGTPRLDVAA